MGAARTACLNVRESGMVGAMRPLQAFLEIAAARGAQELVLQSGQPLVVGDGRRDEPVGDVVADEELSAALRGVLSDEQQIELAVGNVVEFQVHQGGTTWTLVTDPRFDGVVIRGWLRAHAGARSRSRSIRPRLIWGRTTPGCPHPGGRPR